MFSGGVGLPVEFDNGGHVLWRGTPISMSKGTISMWFRVPTETAEEVERGDFYQRPDVLNHMLPILAFSGQHTGPWTEMLEPQINTFYYATNPTPPFNFQPFPYYGLSPARHYRCHTGRV